jgi:hypothetical protein
VGSNPTPSANSLFVAVRQRSETFKIALKIGTFYLDTSVAIRHNPSQCHGMAATPDSSALRASTPRPRSRQIRHFLYRHRFASSPRHPLQLRRAPCAPCSRLASSADTSTSPSTTVPNPRATISSPMKTSGGDEPRARCTVLLVCDGLKSRNTPTVAAPTWLGAAIGLTFESA